MNENYIGLWIDFKRRLSDCGSMVCSSTK